MGRVYKCMGIITMLMIISIVAEEPPKWDDGSFEPSSGNFIGQNQLNQPLENATVEDNKTDEIIDSLIQSGRQGRNLDGFDEVYSDPSVQEVLQKGDDKEARNIIRDKLCDLGLMDCGVQGKRPYYPPNQLIYSKPPPFPPSVYQRPPGGPPSSNGPYGPARPMPSPSGTTNNKFGPPRKIGYAGPSPSYQSGPVYSKPLNSFYSDSKPSLGPYYEGPSPPGPIYDGGIKPQIYEGPHPPGPIYEDSAIPPYKFENIHEKYEFDSNGIPKPAIIVNGQGGATSSGQTGANTINIHHHYHHIDGEQGSAQSGTVLVNKPIPSVATIPIVGSNTLIAGSEYTSSQYGSGGFSPISSGYDNKKIKQTSSSFISSGNNGVDINGVNSGGIYGVANKPIFETTNSVSPSGPGLYGSVGANVQYGQSSVFNGNTGSFHSTNPEYYKKALNTNGALPNYLASYSQSKYTPQFEGQFGNTQSNSGNNQQQLQQQQQQQQQLNQFTSQSSGQYISQQPQQSNQLTSQSSGQYLSQQSSSNNNQFAGQFGNAGNQYNTGEKYQGQGSSYQSIDCVCVPYDQCPSFDIIGRKGDLILPLDPRNVDSEIQAVDEEMVVTDDNGTMIVVRVPKAIEVISLANATTSNATPTIAKNSTDSIEINNKNDENEKKSIKKRDVSEKKSDDNVAAADGEGRQAFYQTRPQQCAPRQVCCRRPARQIYNPGQCGRRNTQGITGRIKNPGYVDGDSEFGEYPWQVAILKKDPKESVYVCGGTLIDPLHVITAAHCVKTYSGYDLRVRLGEWDVNHDVEFFPYVERDITTVIVHPEYYAGTLDNDLAILKFNAPLEFTNTPHISPACLPDKFTDFTGSRCWTTGWGKDAFGDFGKYQNILKEVDVPIIGQQQCQQQLRNTRLGYTYVLNPGFICAGGEEGKDACKGDGGGPMVCERNGNWQLIGVVSWGIGCGQVNVPGVYVRVSHYLDWINQVTQQRY